MNWGGKIVGGALGGLVGGPVGALIGALLGHQVDQGVVSISGFGGRADPTLVNRLFFPTTFRVMGHVAKADGRVSEREIAAARAIMQALHLNEAQVQAAIGYFNEGKQGHFDLDGSLRQLRAVIAHNPELSIFFMEIQMQAAIAGDGLSSGTRVRLQRSASLLGLGAQDFHRIESILQFRAAGARQEEAQTRGGTGNSQAAAERLTQAYSLLGANVSMPDAQIVKAYRRQMSQHHPDKLTARGLPDSMLERAKERTQAIQAAYELVRRARGMR